MDRRVSHGRQAHAYLVRPRLSRRLPCAEHPHRSDLCRRFAMTPATPYPVLTLSTMQQSVRTEAWIDSFGPTAPPPALHRASAWLRFASRAPTASLRDDLTVTLDPGLPSRSSAPLWVGVSACSRRPREFLGDNPWSACGQQRAGNARTGGPIGTRFRCSGPCNHRKIELLKRVSAVRICRGARRIAGHGGK